MRAPGWCCGLLAAASAAGGAFAADEAVAPLGGVVAPIRLRRGTSYFTSHARPLLADGGRARAITRWFQH
jgi:hypothetical protein